jgi:hypothetical protein
LAEINRIEGFIENFCLQERIYDEYFGIIYHSLSVIIEKLMQLNEGREGYYRISKADFQSHVDFIITASSGLTIYFELSANQPTDIAIQRLVDKLSFEDDVTLRLSYHVKSIHRQEYFRRDELVKKYLNSSDKVKRKE